MNKAGKQKTVWMSQEEIECLFNYHIERIGNDLYSSSTATLAISQAYSVREYLKSERTDLYDTIYKWDDLELSYWFLDLEISLLDEEEEKEFIKNYKCMCEKYGLHLLEERESIYNGIIETSEYIEENYNNEFQYLSKWLEYLGIDNNIKEFADVLVCDGWRSVLSHIKVEKKCLYTNLMNSEKILKLCNEYGCIFKVFTDYYWCDTGYGGKLEISNKKFVFIMECLWNKGYIRNDWQSLIPYYKIKTQTGKIINRRDLNEALRNAKETAENFIYGKANEKQQEYEEIKRFVESL